MVPTIPPNMSLVVGPDGKTYMRKKKRRRGPKMSKKRRDAISRGLRRFKLPALTIGANAIPLLNLIRGFTRWQFSQIRVDPVVQAIIFNGVVSPYIGVKIHPEGGSFRAEFAPGELLKGIGPNLVVGFLKRQRIFQGVNRMLTRLGVPIGLS